MIEARDARKGYTMTLHTKFPAWLLLDGTLEGAEGEENSSTDTSGDQGDAQNGSAGDPPGDDDDDNEDDLPEDFSKLPDDHPLKKSLRAARLEAKKAARDAKAKDKELARLQKERDDRELAKKDETEREKTLRERAEQRLEKLTTGYRTSAVDRAIEKAAQAAGFRDADDAVSGVDRNAIEVEQDEDDPSQVKVSTKTVEKAVKDLAARKPHYLKSGTDDGAATGSSFGGAGGGKGKAKTSDEALQDRYPALRPQR